MTRLRFLCESVVVYAVLGPMLLLVFFTAGNPWALWDAATREGPWNAVLTILWGLVFLPVGLWNFGIPAGLIGGGLCLLLIQLGVARRPLVFFASLGALTGAVLGVPFPKLVVASGARLGSSEVVGARGAAIVSGGVCGLIVACRGWKALRCRIA